MINIKEKLKQNNSNGFSLLEVMIALAIFAIGILALGNLQVQSTNYNSSAREFTDAVLVGQNQMEQLMAVPFTDASLTGDPTMGVQGVMISNGIPINSNGSIAIYTAQWIVTDRDLNGNGTVDYKEVALRVFDPSDPAGVGTPRFITNFSRAVCFN